MSEDERLAIKDVIKESRSEQEQIGSEEVNSESMDENELKSDTEVIKNDTDQDTTLEEKAHKVFFGWQLKKICLGT